MAHAVKKVTNQQVADALRLMGLNDVLGTSPDLTGAQNTDFKRKMLMAGISGADFDRAILMAKDITAEKVDPKGNQAEQIIQSLRIRGVPDDVIKSIVADAINSPLNRSDPNAKPGISQATPGGQTFDVSSSWTPGSTAIGGGPGAPRKISVAALLDSAAKFNSGATESVRGVLSKTPGVSTPPPPPTSPAAAPATQPPPTTGRPLAGGRNVLHHGPARPRGKPAGTGAPGAGAPGGSTTDGGTPETGGLAANAGPAEIEAYFRKHYGAEAWMLNIPDFKDIIKGAATGSGWTVQSIVSAVQATPWWQQNGQNVADYLKKKANDPVGFQQGLDSKTTAIKGELARFGITLPEDRILQLGDESFKWNWTTDQIAKTVADEFTYREGQQSVFIDKLKSDAKNFLVPIDEGTVNLWGDKLIMGGENEAGNWANFLKERAKSMYADPDIQRRLDEGENMAQISSTYAELAAKTLEMDPKDIDFTDPKWMSALDSTNEKGERRAMTYSDWTRKLKTEEVYRYDYTEGAKQNAMGMATGLLKKFGAIA